MYYFIPLIKTSVYKTRHSRIEIDATAAFVFTSYTFVAFLFYRAFLLVDELLRIEAGVNATVNAILASLEDAIQTMQPLYSITLSN